MSFTDDNLPLDDASGEDVAPIEDELDTPDADAEMSGGLEEDSDEDEEPALEDDDEADDDEEDEDDEDPRDARIAELEERIRREEYERQQANNQAYWAGIEQQAVEAFEWEEAQIWANKDNYVDPDAFVRQEMRRLKGRIQDWYSQFYASQNESRRQQYERAAVPTYAARVATHFNLSEQQAKDLLDYTPQDMVREARKMARYNQQIAALKKTSTQKKRKQAQEAFVAEKGVTTGGGRAPARKIKAGSMDHLIDIFQQASAR